MRQVCRGARQAERFYERPPMNGAAKIEKEVQVANRSEAELESGSIRQRSGRRWLSLGARWLLPVLVTGAIFGYLLPSLDIAAVWNGLTPRVLYWFAPALIIFLAISLFVEAVCLVVVISDYHRRASLWDAARMKAASYLLGLINYALGAGALTLLLRRRGRLSLSDSAGVVLLIGLFDLGSLLLLGAGAGLMLGAGGPAVPIALVGGMVAAIVAGFAVLRTPRPLGWLDTLRDLQFLQAARTVSTGCLVRLGILRMSFIGSFVLLVWATLMGFGLSVPPAELVANVVVMLLVAVFPFAVAGLGTGQLVFVELFEAYAPAETLFAASITLSAGLIISRAIMGLVFAREFTAEALAATRSGAGEPEQNEQD
jgi:hypothetical protein